MSIPQGGSKVRDKFSKIRRSERRKTIAGVSPKNDHCTRYATRYGEGQAHLSHAAAAVNHKNVVLSTQSCSYSCSGGCSGPREHRYVPSPSPYELSSCAYVLPSANLPQFSLCIGLIRLFQRPQSLVWSDGSTREESARCAAC